MSAMPETPLPLDRPVVVLVVLTEKERQMFFGRSRVMESNARTTVQDLWSDTLDAARWEEQLAALRPDVLISGWSTPPLPESWVASDDCPLRYVCHVTGTVRRLVPRVFLERGGRVSNWGGLAARSVAEHALLLGLAALRDLPAWKPVLETPRQSRVWDSVRTRPLRGSRVGLHGFGAVARTLVELLRPFDVQICAYSAGVPDELMRDAGVTPVQALVDAFKGRDIVFDCEALTPQTQGSVTAEVLAALPDGAVFVNVGRGRVIDEPALVREASSGRIRVAVDVMSSEPAQADSPLVRAGALVSPHVAGPTVAEYPVLGDHALANVRRFLEGRPLDAVVTIESYDRST